MPAGLGKANLAQIGPTSEELEIARSFLAQASGAQVKDKHTNMASWLKQNPDPTVQASRWAERHMFLINFRVRQSRANTAQKHIIVTHTAATANLYRSISNCNLIVQQSFLEIICQNENYLILLF